MATQQWVVIFFCSSGFVIFTEDITQQINMAMLPTQALAELRHQIAAVIDPSLAVSVEPKTAADIAKAAAYVAQRKSIKVVGGVFVDGVALPTDDPFLNWVTAGGLIVPSAQLPDFILQLVGAFLNKSGINQKGG